MPSLTLKIGCGEWGFRELPPVEHFRIAQQFGFRTLEIGLGGPRHLPTRMTDREVADFAKLRDGFGIATPFCCIENDFTVPDIAPVLRETLAQMELATRLGATHVRLFAGFTPAKQMTEDRWQRMIEAFAQCAQRGLQIAIETHGQIVQHDGAAHHIHTVSTDRTSVARLVRELPANVGFNFDPGNLKAVAPDDRSFLLDLINDRINYCHLKDWRRKGTGWEAVAIGDDDLDYAALLPRLRYEGVYLIEYEPTRDVEAGIRRSLDYLRRIGAQLVFA